MRHVLWFIANAPGHDLAGSPHTGFQQLIEPEAYGQAKTLWLSLIEKDRPDADVLYNAARFFAGNERTLANELFTRGMALEPAGPRWKEPLADFAMLGTEEEPSQAKAAVALPLFEAVLSEAASEEKRYYTLEKVADAALQAGEDAKARSYAEELLALSERLPREWNEGNAIHEGNRVLGHVALRAGDAEAAGAYLLKAGATPGSTRLNSFGPKLTLASELLAKGQRDVVIRYLEMCERFWHGYGPALQFWIAEIRAGGYPS